MGLDGMSAISRGAACGILHQLVATVFLVGR
jgi:hypothetical protein